jgi:hypothetical protein
MPDKIKYTNDFISVFVDTMKQAQYVVQTYDNINSITVVNKSTNVYIGVNDRDYLTGTISINPGQTLRIDGKQLQKINAPLTFYADNVGPHSPPGYMYIILKRYI